MKVTGIYNYHTHKWFVRLSGCQLHKGRISLNTCVCNFMFYYHVMCRRNVVATETMAGTCRMQAVSIPRSGYTILIYLMVYDITTSSLISGSMHQGSMHIIVAKSTFLHVAHLHFLTVCWIVFLYEVKMKSKETGRSTMSTTAESITTHARGSYLKGGRCT